MARHSLAPNGRHWPVSVEGKVVGKITSAVYSPRLKKNIALAMLQIEHTELGTQGTAETSTGTRHIVVVPKPFYDPEKKITSG